MSAIIVIQCTSNDDGDDDAPGYVMTVMVMVLGM